MKTIFTSKTEITGELSGLVTVPDDIKDGEKLPVIVFLHGAGERGANGSNFEKLIMTHGIPKYFGKDSTYGSNRVITLSPACPSGLVWDIIAYPLKSWIDAAVDKFGGDKQKIAITGISMGGFGTWCMITSFPEYFCCAAPICGGGISWRTDCLKDFPIRVFHGIDDGSVPFEYSFIMTREARKNGADVTLTSFDHTGHCCWDNAYETTDLISWLSHGGK